MSGFGAGFGAGFGGDGSDCGSAGGFDDLCSNCGSAGGFDDLYSGGANVSGGSCGGVSANGGTRTVESMLSDVRGMFLPNEEYKKAVLKMLLVGSA
jgi:hypothetical protein